jgi:hypothetical protein
MDTPAFSFSISSRPSSLISYRRYDGGRWNVAIHIFYFSGAIYFISLRGGSISTHNLYYFCGSGGPVFSISDLVKQLVKLKAGKSTMVSCPVFTPGAARVDSFIDNACLLKLM